MMAEKLKYYVPRWTKTKVAVGLVGVTLVLTILYYLGDNQWEHTHLRISYLSTETYNQTCWKTEKQVIIIDINQSNLTLFNQSWKIGENIIPSWANVTELWPELNVTSYTPGGGILEAMELNQDKVMLYWILLCQNETREVKVNWIQLDGQNPQWYYTQACVKELNVTYWKEDVIEPASFQKNRCHKLIPNPGTFLGNLNLTCSHQRIELAQDPGPGEKNSTDLVENRAEIETPEVSLWKPPRVIRQPTPRLHTCIKEKAFKLDPCMWNLGPIGCQKQNYLVLSQATEKAGQVDHEEWVNETLPWIWKKKVAYLTVGEHTTNVPRMEHLSGPSRAEVYIQKLPTPEELWAAPKEDFAKIDECAVKKMSEELNGTDFETGGGTKYDWVSPRCEISQVSAWTSGYWTYDCTRLNQHKTLKGALQAWVEHFYRVTEKTWWGLQEHEVKSWVIPCLSKTSNYWIKYQYLATVYSLGDGLTEWYGWTGIRPKYVLTPRPWKMTCDQNNSTCTVELSRRPCGEIPGWETTCKQWYGGGYETFMQGAKWEKSNIHMHKNATREKLKNQRWQRATNLWNRGCVRALLGPMVERRDLAGQVVPFIGLAEQTRMEGHAFRKSLCEGKEVEGYEWLGPNNMYNNGTCEQPQEMWLQCGNHDCTVAELYGRTLLEGIVEVPKEIIGKVEEGASMLVNQLSEAVKNMVPYILMGLGVLILGLLTLGSLKGVFQSACKRKHREVTPLTREELRLLLQEEGLNPL